MRGKGSSVIFDCVISGITPAYAGKSYKYIHGRNDLKDHPRLCGEKLRCLHQRSFRSGITPAYAGKSLPCFTGFIQSQDHPRLCGEK